MNVTLKRSPLLFLAIITATTIAPAATPTPTPNYEDHIKPLFRDHCLKCHNADKKKGSIDLSTYDAVIASEVVEAGRPASSILYQSIIHSDEAEAMPPKSSKLAAAKLDLIRDWIRAGLIPGKGGKSKLRSITALSAPSTAQGPGPMPENLSPVASKSAQRRAIPHALTASPNAPLFAVSGLEQIHLYGRSGRSPDTPVTPLGTLPFPSSTIHDLKFSRDGSLLLAAGGRGAHSGSVSLYDVKTGKRVAEFGDETDSVLAADISSDRRFVAIGGPNKIVKIFDAQTGELKHRIEKHTDWVTAVSFSPDGKLVATGDRAGGIHVWEAEPGAIVFSLTEHKVRITSLDWRSDGKLLASAAEDGAVILWDTNDGWPARNLAAHVTKQSPSRYSRYTGVLNAAFDTAGRVVTVGRDRSIRVWDGDGLRVSELKTDVLPVNATFMSDGQRVAIGLFNGGLQVWDTKDGSVQQIGATSN